MKKKLLITLGCSYTEGVGCYEPTLLDDQKNPLTDQVYTYRKSLDRFHMYGWPVQLQKKLQYDLVWNLGNGGSSNSGQVKKWMEVFSLLSEDSLIKEYDVLVIWMITFVSRISFYKNGKITNLYPGISNSNSSYQNLYNGYIEFLDKTTKKDTLLEAYFYVNILKTICKLSGYQFLYINAVGEEGIGLDTLVQSECSLNYSYKLLYPSHRNIIGDIITENGNEYRAFCGHPNEKGYEILAERLFNVISQTHPRLVNDMIPEKYEMKYLGEPRQW